MQESEGKRKRKANTVFALHYMVWGRKPSYTSLMLHGTLFSSWDNAFETAVNMAVNPEQDPHEIVPEDEKVEKVVVHQMPTTEKELIKLLKISEYDVKFQRGGFTEFWDSEHCEGSRLFQIVPVAALGGDD